MRNPNVKLIRIFFSRNDWKFWRGRVTQNTYLHPLRLARIFSVSPPESLPPLLANQVCLPLDLSQTQEGIRILSLEK